MITEGGGNGRAAGEGDEASWATSGWGRMSQGGIQGGGRGDGAKRGRGRGGNQAGDRGGGSHFAGRDGELDGLREEECRIMKTNCGRGAWSIVVGSSCMALTSDARTGPFYVLI